MLLAPKPISILPKGGLFVRIPIVGDGPHAQFLQAAAGSQQSVGWPASRGGQGSYLQIVVGGRGRLQTLGIAVARLAIALPKLVLKGWAPQAQRMGGEGGRKVASLGLLQLSGNLWGRSLLISQQGGGWASSGEPTMRTHFLK